MKIAVLGAGSFVFGPSVLKEAVVEQRLDGAELALMDPNRPVVEMMAAVGQRWAREQGLAAKISAYADRAAAIDGADFVICSAARELWRRFDLDCQIIHRHDPMHLISEFGGVQGISYSLRQIALIQEIAADMKRLCPKAWLLDSANPMPRVTQAAHEEGIPTVGFCSASLMANVFIWELLGNGRLDYPFEPARSRLKMTMAGLNHFTWVLDIQDSQTGENLYPRIRQLATGSPEILGKATARILAETGYMLTPGDNHIKDFIEPCDEAEDRTAPGHGSPEERSRREAILRDAADGKAPCDAICRTESWEKPVRFIAAFAGRHAVEFESLNLINQGQIPTVSRSVFVETPVAVCRGQVTPKHVDLPPQIQPMCQRTAAVTDKIVRTARQRSRKLLREAVEIDPTIVDKQKGFAALEECLQAHADLLPRYS